MFTTPPVFWAFGACNIRNSSIGTTPKGKKFHSSYRVVVASHDVEPDKAEIVCIECSFFPKMMDIYYKRHLTHVLKVALTPPPGRTRGKEVTLTHELNQKFPDSVQKWARPVHLTAVVNMSSNFEEDLYDWGAESLVYRSWKRRYSMRYRSGKKLEREVWIRKGMEGYDLFVKESVAPGEKIEEYTGSIIDKK